MYVSYNDTVAISVNDWITAGLTKNIFEHDSKRGDLKIVRRGINGNTLIDVRSIRRPDRRAKIEAAFGKIEEKAKVVPFLNRIRPDQKAKEFFDSYTYGEGKHLDERLKTVYCNSAAVLNALHEVYREHRAARLSAGSRVNHGKFMEAAARFVKESLPEWPHSLPKSVKRLGIVFKGYLKDGYVTLVSGKLGNQSSEKLNEAGQRWVLARWATPIDKLGLSRLFAEYNVKAAIEGWKPLKSEQTLRNYLERPDIKVLWYGARRGELKAKEAFVPQHRTLLASCRDANWYGDGTKLNYFYRDENGKIATCNVYEVVDEYSECLLGFAVSKTEDFAAQYKAYRMALDFSGQKPFQVTFDNQGGHKKLASEKFFAKMAHLCIGTQPYNGKSKTIESIFKRFQEGYLRRDWFFTGMNITTHKAESRLNAEMLAANKGSLPTLQEAVKIYEQRRREWNQAPHPKTGRPRIEMYYSSRNERCTPIQLWERIDLFGLMTAKPVVFRASGIEIQVQGIKYAYDVLGPDGFTDMEFRKKHTGGRFYLEYDPDDLSTVALYQEMPGGDKKFVALASKYIHIHRAKQDQTDQDHRIIARRDAANKDMREEIQERIEGIMEAEGLHPSQHGLNMPQPRMNRGKRKGGRLSGDILGRMAKKESNLVAVDADGATDEFNGY